MKNWLQNLRPLNVRVTNDTNGMFYIYIPEIHFQNVVPMIRACEAKCDGIVAILKYLGVTMNYKEDCHESKTRGILKTCYDNKMIATLSFMSTSASVKIRLWTERTYRRYLSFNIPLKKMWVIGYNTVI